MAVFGHSIELRRALYRATVRIGVGGASALIASLCAQAVIMDASAPGGHYDPASARAIVPGLAVIAGLSAALIVFGWPYLFSRVEAIAAPLREAAGAFGRAMQSDSAYDRAAGKLGLLAIFQMIAAAVPAMLGLAAFTAGAGTSVFAVFVALSVVILAAVYPRAREWNDSIERNAEKDGLARTASIEDKLT